MTTFIKPSLPGTKIEFTGEETVRPPAAIAATVAIPIVHDWGPLGSAEGPQRFNSFAEFEGVYGDSNTDGRDAVLGAFVGPGVAGEAGAGSVIVYRMATGAAAKAGVTLQNTAATPANALRLEAVYAGDRGEQISIVVEDDPVAPATTDRLRVLFDGVTVERYSYAQTNITALADAIDANSKYVTSNRTAVPIVDGTTLATHAEPGVSLTGGDNGGTLTGTEWSAALDALEFEPFSIFAPHNLTDAAVMATILQWVRDQADAQRPVVAVLGGAAGETLDAAITRTAALRDHHIVSLGAGTFHDDYLDEDVGTAKLAPRVAGILAGRGEERSLTYAKLSGLSVVGTPAILTEDLEDARDAGITAFRRTSATDAELRISQGVTTFISTTTAGRPYEIFSDPRLVRVIDLFVRRLKEWGDENIIGETRVIEETRSAVRDQGKAELSDLLARGLILPGTEPADEPFFRVVDTSNDPTLTDAIPFEFGWKFTRTTNYLVGQGRVR